MPEKTMFEQIIDELRAELNVTQLNLDMWHDRAENMRNRLTAEQDENDKLREQSERLFDKTLELGTENAKLRELYETFGMIANDAICDYYDRDELLAQANVDACELGVEL